MAILVVDCRVVCMLLILHHLYLYLEKKGHPSSVWMMTVCPNDGLYTFVTVIHCKRARTLSLSYLYLIYFILFLDNTYALSSHHGEYIKEVKTYHHFNLKKTSAINKVIMDYNKNNSIVVMSINKVAKL